jgi:hypothetical protein
MWFISCWSGILPAFCGDIGSAGRLGSRWGHILFRVVGFSRQPNLFPVIALLLLLDAPLPTATSNHHLLSFFREIGGIFGKLARGLELLISSTSGIGYLLFHCLNNFLFPFISFVLSILVSIISSD